MNYLALRVSTCALILAFCGLAEGESDSAATGRERPCPDGVLVRETASIENRLPDASWVRRRCWSARSPVVGYTVGVDGSAWEAQILHSTGCDNVDVELLRCVSMWRFEPATCDRKPIVVGAAATANWGYGTAKEDDDSHRACAPSARLGVVSGLWRRLLQGSVGKSHVEHLLVERVAEVMPSTLEGELARLVLEEWDLPPDTTKLREPRIVMAPNPDFPDSLGEVRLSSPVIVVTGQVTPIGVVENTEVKIGSGVEEFDRLCIDAFSRWRYRPAREKTGYVASDVAVTFHVNLK